MSYFDTLPANATASVNQTRIIRSIDNKCMNRGTSMFQATTASKNPNKEADGRQTLINFSPVKRRRPPTTQKAPVPIAILELAQFKRPPVIEFGVVIVGQVKSMLVSVRNLQSHSQVLKVTNVPTPDKGFHIEQSRLTLEPNSQLTLSVKWAPTKAGRYRECINFHDGNRFPFKIVLVGSTIEPEVIKTRPQRPQAVAPKAETPRLVIRTRESSNSTVKQAKPSRIPEHKAKLAITSALILNHRKRWSGLLVRQLAAWSERDSAARTIQHFFQMVKDRSHYLKLRKAREERRQKAATLIQSTFRAFLLRKNYIKLRESTTFIQSRIRMLLAKRQLQELKKQRDTQNKAAIVLQKNIRSFVLRKRYLMIRQSTILIQRQFRMILAKRQLEKLKEQNVLRNKAALVLVKNLRSHIARKRYLSLKGAATVLQRNFRVILAKRQLQILRELRDQRHRENRAALLLQNTFRAYVARTKYAKLKCATLMIQARRRMIVQKRRYDNLKRLATILQSNRRMIAARKKYNLLKQSTIMLQSYVRMWLVKTRYSAAKLILSKIRLQMRNSILHE